MPTGDLMRRVMNLLLLTVIHWGTYSVPSYAPVIPGKLAYAEWYWNAMTNGKSNPNADELQKGTWAFHQKVYGGDFPYENFASQFRAELLIPTTGPSLCVFRGEVRRADLG